MTVEVLRDLDARLRGVKLERWLDGATQVIVRGSDDSLLGAVCVLPVIEAVRRQNIPVTIEGNGLGVTWLRLASSASAASLAPVGSGSVSAPFVSSDLRRTSPRTLVLDITRQLARIDPEAGALHVPYARAHRPEAHPMERWARGALAAGLPARREPPRVDLGARVRRDARRALRARGARIPLVLLASRASSAVGASPASPERAAVRSDVMLAVERALGGIDEPRTPGHLEVNVMRVGALTSATLRDELARACLATLVIGDDDGFLHAAAACGAHVMAVGADALAPPYPSAIWVRTPDVALLFDEIERAVLARFPWDLLALRLP